VKRYGNSVNALEGSRPRPLLLQWDEAASFIGVAAIRRGDFDWPSGPDVQIDTNHPERPCAPFSISSVDNAEV
jgi:hypothetical protein